MTTGRKYHRFTSSEKLANHLAGLPDNNTYPEVETVAGFIPGTHGMTQLHLSDFGQPDQGDYWDEEEYTDCLVKMINQLSNYPDEKVFYFDRVQNGKGTLVIIPKSDTSGEHSAKMTESKHSALAEIKRLAGLK
jgi:hypothetical protein